LFSSGIFARILGLDTNRPTRMLLKLINIVTPVLIITLLGYVFAKKQKKAPDMEFTNYVNVHVFCPALIFSALVAEPIHFQSAWALILGGILVIILPGVFLYFLRPSTMNRKAYLVTGMFRNTGNVGIPLAILAYGTEQLGDIIILFVLSNSLHFSLGLFLLSGAGNRWLWLRNPNVWAALLGLSLAPYQAYVPDFALTSIELMGQITIPLMLFSLGVRIAQDQLKHVGFAFRINLLYLLTGALSLPFVFWLLPLSPDAMRLLALSAMLPPAVLNFLLCEHYNVAPKAVANIVLLGNMMAVVVIPVVIWLSLTFI